MSYRSRIGAYQRMRTIILKDAWLIDNEHKNDGGEIASGTESDEDMTDTSAATDQGHRRTRNPTTKATTTAVVTTLPRWAKHQSR
jgi:hypothetical protein